MIKYKDEEPKIGQVIIGKYKGGKYFIGDYGGQNITKWLPTFEAQRGLVTYFPDKGVTFESRLEMLKSWSELILVCKQLTKKNK